MARLTNGQTLTDVGTRDQSQTANKSGSTVRQQITVQVGGDNDIVVLRLTEELVNHGVDNLFLNRNTAVLGSRKGDLGSFAEKTIGLRQDIGLVSDGDDGALVDAGNTRVTDLLSAKSDVTSHGSNAQRSLLGNALDGLGYLALGGVAGSLLLDVEILGVFTNDDHVDGLGGREDSLDGSNVGVEVETLAESHNGRGVALDGVGGRAHGTEEGSLALIAESVDCGIGEGSAGLLEGLETGLEVDKVELESGQSFEDALSGGNDFLADTVAGNEA